MKSDKSKITKVLTKDVTITNHQGKVACLASRGIFRMQIRRLVDGRNQVMNKDISRPTPIFFITTDTLESSTTAIRST